MNYLKFIYWEQLVAKHTDAETARCWFKSQLCYLMTMLSWKMIWFPDPTNYYKNSGLNQQKFVLLQFWNPAVRKESQTAKNKVMAWLVSSGGSRADSIFLFPNKSYTEVLGEHEFLRDIIQLSIRLNIYLFAWVNELVLILN